MKELSQKHTDSLRSMAAQSQQLEQEAVHFRNECKVQQQQIHTLQSTIDQLSQTIQQLQAQTHIGMVQE